MYTPNKNNLSIILTIFSFLVVFLASAAQAADVTLTWNKPNDDRVVGYHIYSGVSGTDFTSTPVQTINSADQTSCLILNLEEGQTYNIAATSFDLNSDESDFSETISYAVPVTPVDNDGDGYTAEDGDCNDSDSNIYPGASEICGDGIDQDCNGNDLTCPEDIDNDGDGYTENEGDCDDSEASIHPGAIEICGDGIDQDCSGSDLECSPDPADTDDDGDGYSENEGDCNDNAATIFPGAIEICGDGIDQDCNGSDLLCTAIDGLTLSWIKPDDDRVAGYNIYCGKTGTDFKVTPYVSIYSADTTSYTFTDLENGFEYSFVATSFDIYGTESDFSETITCFVGDSGDLTDETQTVMFGDTLDADYPGTVVDTFINLNEEVNFAGDHLNTYTWPENMPANAIMLQFDLSQIPAGAQIQSATLSLYQTAAGGDASYEIAAHKIINHHPDLYQATGYTFDGVNDWTANDACYNSIPLAQADIALAEDVQNLDLNSGYKQWNVISMVQEWVNNASPNYGLMLNSDTIASSGSYRFFAASEAVDASQRPSLEVTYTTNGPSDVDGDGYTVIDGDCDDNDASINPGAVEICGDGIDQDCNGSDLTCPEDIDHDGDGYTENQSDCNDNDPSIYPGAPESCGDGIDQDCNGSDLTCPEDIDNDSDGYTENQGDCDDNDASINPGAFETCGDGIDQDCSGSDLTCPEDIDNDSDGFTENEGDCNDSDPSIYPGAAETCGDGIDQDCNGSDLTCPEDIDNDGDGYTENQGDCNDGDASVYPGAAEICGDGIDQNCSGSDLTCPEDIDDDSDGYTENQGDCNDSDASIYPDAAEICGDGIDQDCNGSDLDCPEDIDNDGDGFTENEGDCNDSDASIYPGAAEICGDGIDQDCNGSDLSCPEDIDNDEDGYTENQGDCNDMDPSIYPGALETCGDGIDQDCSGSDLTCPEDIDDDGDGYTENQGDCNDNDLTIYPGAIEICEDGIDQDCDGTDLDCVIDNDTQTVVFGDTLDADYPGTVVDTFINLNEDLNYAGDQLNTFTWPENMPANAIMLKFDLSQIPAGAQIQSATLSLFQTAAGGDATYDVSVHKVINHNPDLYQANGYTFDGVNEWTANNACYNSIPLAQADIGLAADVQNLDPNPGYKQWNVTSMVQEWVSDASANYGLMLNSDTIAVSGSHRFFASSEAIDASHRPVLEVKYTSNVSTSDVDADGDGYTESEGDCNDNDTTTYPGAPEICGDGIDQDCNGSDSTCPEDIDDDSDGYTENEGDCNDSDASIYPGAAEICGDGIDQDCNGSDLSCPEDIDNDEDGYTENQGDCNDMDPSIYPGAPETCGDGIDQDCNGSDLDCPEDIDNDGDGFTENEGDCNDSDASIYPGAAEICGDGIDQDCNGSDLSCPEDIDIDEDGYTENQGDCNDMDPSIYPGAPETCGDGIDQDCNGSDLDCPEDIDNDGDGFTENEGDCNDSDASIYPGAAEICGDGIDQDCNGSDLTCPEDIDNDEDGYTENQGDCNDMDPSIYPGALETCGDGIDQDCNGSDLDCPEDIDNDGDGFTENEGDCNDNDATIFPGAIEICGDGIDQDCDGSDLECIREDILGFVMETGEAEVNHDWQFVPFTKTYVNPVVVANPMGLNGGQPAVVRVKNVTPDGFEIRIQEWDYLDGWHAYESVGYMVMEAGHHVLNTGIHVEAGTFESNSTRKTANFEAAFNQIPVLVSGVITENELDAVTGRLSNITLNGFDVMLQEQESSKSGHYADETVSYIAWEPSSGEVDGMNYIVDSTFNEVTHKFSNIGFYPVFNNAPVFMADMQTTNGGDTANVRWQNKTGEGVEVQIDEEQSQNTEVNHITEVVGYMAFSFSE